MTQAGMPCNRVDSRMDRSLGVQLPQRLFWFATQRTVRGSARPSRYFALSPAARRTRPASLGRRRFSERSSRATMVATHSRSSARVNRAGTSTTTLSSSR